jgi:hypothetical protein
MSRIRRRLRLPYETEKEAAQSLSKRSKRDEYILMMTGTKAGVGTYRAWYEKDRQAHMAVLTRINKELSESGEFVATCRAAL